MPKNCATGNTGSHCMCSRSFVSWVRDPLRSLNFFSIYLILPAAVGYLGLTHPLAEMSTRNRKNKFLVSRELLPHKSDNLCKAIAQTVWDVLLTTLLASIACHRDRCTFLLKSFVQNALVPCTRLGPWFSLCTAICCTLFWEWWHIIVS
jgi:hypothetical protein